MEDTLKILSYYKEDIEAELERHLPRGGEPAKFYDPIWDLLDRGGKRFRAALTFLACESVGGRKEDAVGAAAATELLHNMTLIHDDIEDNSELRRGKPCIHRIYGVPTAINAGDAMLIKVFEIANSTQIPHEQARRLVAQFAKRAYEVTYGQALEFEMWRKRQFKEEDVIRLLKYKTGALTRLSTESGAIAGGATDREFEALGEFGETIGIAFQIVDDILNLTGDQQEYGKEIGGDIREGKKTVMAAHLLSKASPKDESEFLKLLGNEKTSRKQILRGIKLYKKYECVEYATSRAKIFLKNSLKALDVLPETQAKRDLTTLAEFLVSRSY